MASNDSSTIQPVVIDYSELIDENADLGNKIEEAYGYNGLGILAVKNVPDFVKLRENLLPLANKFANLPDEVKEETVHAKSFYSFGWSHGKEKMRKDVPDTLKGSYYNNPVLDVPTDNQEWIEKFPSFCHPNIWPEKTMPELAPAFKAMGKLIVDVGLLIAKHCDKYVHSKLPAYPEHRLYKVLSESRTHKARLLHYFPLNAEQRAELGKSDDSVSDWCGWHNDHGSLTGLTPAMYMKDGKPCANPDPKSGLYIKSRNNTMVKAAVPSDYLLFQIGETAQIHSGGILQATPHGVRGTLGEDSNGVSRETFAVFMEPMMFEPMDIPQGATEHNVTRGSAHLPEGVPHLATRWNQQQDFAKFSEETLKSYY
jgi:isopenicillin N synthase-like dioxygenase